MRRRPLRSAGIGPASLLLILTVASNAMATSPRSPADRAAADDRPPIVPVAKALEGAAAIPGLLPIHRDETTGSLLLHLRAEHFDRPFIQCAFVQDGPTIAGFFRGEFRENRIVRFRRDYDRVDVVAENTAYHFDPASPLARAASANRLDAVLARLPVTGENKATGEVVVEADSLFLEETLTQLSSPPPKDEKAAHETFALGELDADRTRIVAVRNYPENTDVVVEYVFSQPAPAVRGGADVTDPRFISVRVQHSLIAAPDSGYRPRLDDPRVGFFTVERTDLTATHPAPYQDLITRWHLVKKHKGAEVSEPVEPITLWIENTTPHELRPLVRAGALAWNPAFEAAGFRHAIVVKEQPDDATWDAGDIRYNVLRWASSPVPPFGGYGPSFVDPRTGQILGADIMLEFSYLTTRAVEQTTFTALALRRGGRAACRLGAQRQAALQLGRAAAEARGLGDLAAEQLVREAIIELVAHEVGHVLGLMHNKRASRWLPAGRLHDADHTRREGLSASVMDYNQINLAPPGVPQGQYFPDRVGPYDIWAIRFGYSEPLDDPEAEAGRREALLARSTEPALAFGNDADEVTEPGAGVDPRVLSFDLGDDPVGMAAGRFALLRQLAAAEALRTPPAGASHESVVLKYRVLMRDALDLARMLAVQVGGVHVDRAHAGQPGATRPFTPIPAAEQRRALAVLRREVLGPQGFRVPAEVLAHAQRQRRGFDFLETPEEPQVHADLRHIHALVLDHVLHPRVLDRIADSALYGGDYTVAALGLDLTEAVFGDDAAGPVDTVRQNLQTLYVERLAALLAPTEKPLASTHRAMAVHQLEAIRAALRGRSPEDPSTEAHVAHLLFLISRALDPARA